MPIINHDYKDINLLETIMVKEDGTPLQGEIDIYRRIYADCKASDYTWHFWHDLKLTIPVGNQSEIQIDFFLVCEKGAIVVEVKGEGVGIRNGSFLLNENKRVPTNREIVEYANMLLANGDFDINTYLNDLNQQHDEAIAIHRFKSAKEVVRFICDKIVKIKEESLDWNDYTLLCNSQMKKLPYSGDETIYDRIFDMESTKELTTENIGRPEKRLQFTSILSYKGLENKHIILLISNRTEIDKFELYVGMTRAIYDLEILILE